MNIKKGINPIKSVLIFGMEKNVMGALKSLGHSIFVLWFKKTKKNDINYTKCKARMQNKFWLLLQVGSITQSIEPFLFLCKCQSRVGGWSLGQGTRLTGSRSQTLEISLWLFLLFVLFDVFLEIESHSAAQSRLQPEASLPRMMGVPPCPASFGMTVLTCSQLAAIFSRQKTGVVGWKRQWNYIWGIYMTTNSKVLTTCHSLERLTALLWSTDSTLWSDGSDMSKIFSWWVQMVNKWALNRGAFAHFSLHLPSLPSSFLLLEQITIGESIGLQQG